MTPGLHKLATEIRIAAPQRLAEQAAREWARYTAPAGERGDAALDLLQRGELN